MGSDATYTDIGPGAGHCSVCGREVYATPMMVSVQLMQAHETDKLAAVACWCSRCGRVYCSGCGATEVDRLCPACGVGLAHNPPR